MLRPQGVATTLPPLSVVATKISSLQVLPMGGTGLEPAAPSLSRLCGRSHPFVCVRSDCTAEPNHVSTERLSEPERTAFLAILATRDSADASFEGGATNRANSHHAGIGVTPDFAPTSTI